LSYVDGEAQVVEIAQSPLKCAREGPRIALVERKLSDFVLFRVGLLAGRDSRREHSVGLGGFLGSIAQFWLGGYIRNRVGTRFPYGTIVINITGSFLIGLAIPLLVDRMRWSANWRYLVPIDFIGAQTTFSTF